MRELKYYVLPKKDIVVSKNANFSEESAIFSGHNGENSIFLSRLIPLLGQFLNEHCAGYYKVFFFFVLRPS